MIRRYRAALATLGQARDALHSDVEKLGCADPPDSETVQKLRDVAHGLKQDAHSTLLRLLFEGGPPSMADAADELLELFCQAVRRLDGMLGKK